MGTVHAWRLGGGGGGGFACAEIITTDKPAVKSTLAGHVIGITRLLETRTSWGCTSGVAAADSGRAC